MSRYEAVVFDMDGVLADSEPVYYAAMQSVLRPLGHEVTAEHQRAVMGRGVGDTWEYLQQTFGLEGPLDQLMQAYDMELQEQLSRLEDALPGVRELLAELRKLSVPLAVASSSLPSWMEALLGGLGLEQAFDCRVSAVEVENPKPAPDIYLEAARLLGSPPERCIAIEDTPPGLASARSAGLLTLQVRSSSTAWPPQPDASAVLETLHDFDLSLLRD